MTPLSSLPPTDHAKLGDDASFRQQVRDQVRDFCETELPTRVRANCAPTFASPSRLATLPGAR